MKQPCQETRPTVRYLIRGHPWLLIYNIAQEYILAMDNDSMQNSFTYLSIASAFISAKILTSELCTVVEPLHREGTIASEINNQLKRMVMNWIIWKHFFSNGTVAFINSFAGVHIVQLWWCYHNKITVLVCILLWHHTLVSPCNSVR